MLVSYFLKGWGIKIEKMGPLSFLPWYLLHFMIKLLENLFPFSISIFNPFWKWIENDWKMTDSVEQRPLWVLWCIRQYEIQHMNLHHFSYITLLKQQHILVHSSSKGTQLFKIIHPCSPWVRVSDPGSFYPYWSWHGVTDPDPDPGTSE